MTPLAGRALAAGIEAPIRAGPAIAATLELFGAKPLAESGWARWPLGKAILGHMNRDLYRMRRLVVFLASAFLMSSSAHSGVSPEQTFWVEVIDQTGASISEAIVYYCIEDCVLERNAFNRKQTSTDKNGLAELQIAGGENRFIQGISKAAFDIRLSSQPATLVRLNGATFESSKHAFPNARGWISVRYERDVAPYSMPRTKPLLTFSGWKLGPPTCLEQAHDWIRHGRAEATWEIRDAQAFYRAGHDGAILERGDADTYDSKITVNRSRYPWRGVLNMFLAS